MPYPESPTISHIDYRDESESITVPTTPTLLTLPIKAVERGSISYDTATGVISFSETRVYNLVLFANATTSASRTLYAYAEVSNDGGVTWLPLYGSLRTFSITGTTDGQVQLSVSNNVFSGGQKLRFFWWASGSMTVRTTTIAAAPGYFTPALRMMYGN